MYERRRTVSLSRRWGCALSVSIVLAALIAGCGHRAGDAADRSDAAARRTIDRLPGSLAKRPLAFVRAVDRERDELWIGRPDGSQMRRLEHHRGCKQRPVWSPDGSRIAVRFMPRCDYRRDQVVIVGADDGSFFNLSRAIGVFGNSPSWSPDGRRIAFAGIRASDDRPAKADLPMGIYIAAANGSHVERVTPKSLGEVQYPSWSPDGRTIAFQISTGGAFDLYTVASDGSGLRQLTDSEGYTEWPMWSPDGDWIGYGLEGEQSALWKMRPDGSDKQLIRTGLGVPAGWAPGSWLVANCPLRKSKIGICAVSPDGTAKLTLLGGIDAGFAAWRP